MSWDRTTRRVMESVSGETSAFLHRLLLAIGEHEQGIDALDAALKEHIQAIGADAAQLEAKIRLNDIVTGERRL